MDHTGSLTLIGSATATISAGVATPAALAAGGNAILSAAAVAHRRGSSALVADSALTLDGRRTRNAAVGFVCDSAFAGAAVYAFSTSMMGQSHVSASANRNVGLTLGLVSDAILSCNAVRVASGAAALTADAVLAATARCAFVGAIPLVADSVFAATPLGDDQLACEFKAGAVLSCEMGVAYSPNWAVGGNSAVSLYCIVWDRSRQPPPPSVLEPPPRESQPYDPVSYSIRVRR